MFRFAALSTLPACSNGSTPLAIARIAARICPRLTVGSLRRGANVSNLTSRPNRSCHNEFSVSLKTSFSRRSFALFAARAKPRALSIYILINPANRAMNLLLSAGIRRNANWRRLERFVFPGIAWRRGQPSRPKQRRRSLPNSSACERCLALVWEAQARESMMGVIVDLTGCYGNPASRRRAV